MQVPCAVLVLLAFAAAEGPKSAPDPASESAGADAARSKKSATATVCVEIRPSGPYQRPFQICEPAEAKPYQYYYEEATPKPAAKPAYAAPAAKPSAAPAYAASKPYAAHSPSAYASSYRAEDGDDDEETGNEEELEHLMRSVGDPYSYLQPGYKPKQKKGHNGLVITCQPSLAGYAAPLPSYGSGYGGYRASTARSYNRYERPIQRPQYPSYGPSYKPQPAPAPYKVPAPSYPSYPQMYKPSQPYPSYNPPQHSYSPPQPSYKVLPPPQSPPPQVYKPVYSQPPPPPQASYPVPPPPPQYAPQHPPPAPAPYYPPSPSYAPPPVHSQQVYSPPGTYRAAEDVHQEVTTQASLTEEEKEKHTVEKMKQMAEARMEDGRVKMNEPSWQVVRDDATKMNPPMREMDDTKSWRNEEDEEMKENNL